MKLEDKVSIITGAAKGIGEAIAMRHETKRGFQRIVADINQEGCESTIQINESVGIATAIPTVFDRN